MHATATAVLLSTAAIIPARSAFFSDGRTGLGHAARTIVAGRVFEHLAVKVKLAGCHWHADILSAELPGEAIRDLATLISALVLVALLRVGTVVIDCTGHQRRCVKRNADFFRFT